MERSHVYRGPQLSVGLNLLIHTMLSIGENQNSLLCTNAGEGNLHYCCGSEQQWAGFQASSGGSLYCCITAFYHSTGHAFQNWCPLLGNFLKRIMPAYLVGLGWFFLDNCSGSYNTQDISYQSYWGEQDSSSFFFCPQIRNVASQCFSLLSIYLIPK
jgi:hypothetical protein